MFNKCLIRHKRVLVSLVQAPEFRHKLRQVFPRGELLIAILPGTWGREWDWSPPYHVRASPKLQPSKQNICLACCGTSARRLFEQCCQSLRIRTTLFERPSVLFDVQRICFTLAVVVCSFGFGTSMIILIGLPECGLLEAQNGLPPQCKDTWRCKFKRFFSPTLFTSRLLFIFIRFITKWTESLWVFLRGLTWFIIFILKRNEIPRWIFWFYPLGSSGTTAALSLLSSKGTRRLPSCFWRCMAAQGEKRQTFFTCFTWLFPKRGHNSCSFIHFGWKEPNEKNNKKYDIMWIHHIRNTHDMETTVFNNLIFQEPCVSQTVQDCRNFCFHRSVVCLYDRLSHEFQVRPQPNCVAPKAMVMLLYHILYFHLGSMQSIIMRSMKPPSGRLIPLPAILRTEASV